MTRITIEIDSGAVQSVVGVSDAPRQTARESVAPAAPGIGPPPEVLAQAAMIGAINAGPAPSMTEGDPLAPPIASSVGGAAAAASDVVSGGAAPAHLFGVQEEAPPTDVQ